MLHEVDQSIKSLLFDELQSLFARFVDRRGPIVFGPPSQTESNDLKKPLIRLFLHDVHENLTVRDQSFEIRRTSDETEIGKSRKPTRLNLSYLLTVEAKDPRSSISCLERRSAC